MRTSSVEGAFSLPEASLSGSEGALICWKGGKDKKAMKAWEALKKEVPGLRSLTLGKLKKKQDFLSVRPDLMVKRLSAALGSARVIRLDHGRVVADGPVAEVIPEAPVPAASTP